MRWKPMAWTAGIVLFLYVLFVLPFVIVREDVFRAWILDKQLKAGVLPKDWFLRIGRVERFDPGGLRLHGIRLEHLTAEGLRPWVEVGELEVEFRLAPLARRKIRAAFLRLDSVVVHIDQPPPVFTSTGLKSKTKGKGLAEVPSIRVSDFAVRRIDLRDSTGSVAHGEIVMHDLTHEERNVGAEIDTLRGDWPAESLEVRIVGGRARGLLPDHFTLQDVGISTRGLVTKLDVTARLGRGVADSSLATADLRIDRMRPARISALSRYNLPFGEDDTLRGWARLSYATRRASGIVWLSGVVLGAPLDSLEIRVAQRGDTLDLQSLALRHQAGALAAAGQAILEPLRLRGWVDFTDVNLSDPSLARWLPKQPRLEVDGRVEGSASLDPGSPSASGEVSLSRIVLLDRDLPSLRAYAGLEKRQVTIDSLIVGERDAGLLARGSWSLDDGALQAQASLVNAPLDRWVGPWVRGVPFEGTADGELTVSGTAKSPQIRAKVDARDFRVVEVTCREISIDSLGGGLSPMDLRGSLGCRGLNIYGVDCDTAIIKMDWRKTMRVGLEVRRDTLIALGDVDVIPKEPGYLVIEQLDLTPGVLAPWSMTDKTRISWQRGAASIEGVRFESTEGLVTGHLEVGSHASSLAGAVQIEDLNLDFVRMLAGLPDSSMAGMVKAAAVIGGTPVRLAIHGSLEARDVVAATWPVGPLDTRFGVDEDGTIRLDSLRAGRGDGRGRVWIPNLTVEAPEPLPAFTSGLKDSLAYLFDRTRISGRIEVDDLALNRIIHLALAGLPSDGGGLLAEPVDPMMTRIRTVRPGDAGNGATLEQAVKGDLRLGIDVGGTAGRPEGKVAGQLTGLQVYQAKADSVIFAAAYAPQTAILDSLVWISEGNESRASGRLPLIASFVPGRTSVPQEQPLAFDADLPEIDLAVLSAVSKQILDPSGILSGSIRLRGTPQRLWPEGALSIRDGGLRIPNREERLRAINGDFTLDSAGVRIRTLTGAVGKDGKLEAEGWFRDLKHFQLDGKVTSATAYESGLYHFTFSGDLSAYPVQSPLGSFPLVVGTVLVKEGAIIGDMAKAPLPPTSGKRKPSPWHAEIDVRAPGDIRMSTSIASVDLGEGDLHVSFIDPLINVSGGITVLGGRYRIFNNIFSITSGTVEFRDLGRGLEPILDVYAETEVQPIAADGDNAQATKVTIHVTGPILDLKVEFSSDPVRTEDEIVSLLVMGQLTNPSTGSVGIVDPSRQYLFTELVAQIESQISQLVLPLGNVSVQPGTSPGDAWKINVRQTLMRQVSVAYSRELAQAAGQEVNLRYNLRGKLYLNAGLQRRLNQGQINDRYLLDLKLRFEYK